MIRKVLLVSVILFAGCTGKQVKTWEVQLIRPNGSLHCTHTIESYSKPAPVPCTGGQIRLVDWGQVTLHDWERQIVAPVGWGLNVREPRS